MYHISDMEKRVVMPDASIRIGPLEFEVLDCLIRQPDDAYGITLHKRLESRHQRPFSPGAIYVVLERLERKGLISSRWGDTTPARGGRRKRLYQIEASGRRAADSFSEPSRVSNASLPPELAWGKA
jgi:PadR family transcriptional regulator PadR